MFDISRFDGRIYSFDLATGFCVVNIEYDDSEVSFNGTIYMDFKRKEIELKTIDYQEAQTLNEEELIDYIDELGDFIQSDKAFYKSIIAFMDSEISEHIENYQNYQTFSLAI
jgi:hypothetical protein